MSEPVELSDLRELIQVMRAQTEAINRLAHSSAMLVQAMAEADGEDGEDGHASAMYLDGSRR